MQIERQMKNTEKQLIIISGPNGVGKTTFAKPYVLELNYEFLNADEIVKELEIRGESNSLVKAGRIFFSRLKKFLEEGRSFVVETTLSGTYINKVAAKAQSNGYTVSIIYIFLDNADLCVKRVSMRVFKGGHDVPVEAIKRRFYRSKNNFWNNFISIADNWLLLYNGEKGFQQVAIGNHQFYSINNLALFNIFKSI